MFSAKDHSWGQKSNQPFSKYKDLIGIIRDLDQGQKASLPNQNIFSTGDLFVSDLYGVQSRQISTNIQSNSTLWDRVI